MNIIKTLLLIGMVSVACASDSEPESESYFNSNRIHADGLLTVHPMHYCLRDINPITLNIPEAEKKVQYQFLNDFIVHYNTSIIHKANIYYCGCYGKKNEMGLYYSNGARVELSEKYIRQLVAKYLDDNPLEESEGFLGFPFCFRIYPNGSFDSVYL